MLEEYIYCGTKKLRCGYTTGSCAAAAAKASAQMLLTGMTIDKVSLMTPKGILLELNIKNSEIETDYAECAIKKDSGDDPDVTNGILVYARVEKIPSGVIIDGGKGVGRITKSGLDRKIGEAAINTVPRRMIENAVTEMAEQYGYDGGFRIIISVPEGEKIARKTYNPRLGIEGGISIIGTSGIVEPMSNKAVIETIRTEESMLKAQGRKNLLITIGNYSGTFLKDYLPELDKTVKCSNFIGEAIDFAVEFGFKRILIAGHAGKLVKLGAGIMNTHSSNADGRMEVLITCGLLAGADTETLKKIYECITVDDALGILQSAGLLEKTMEILMGKIQFYLDAKVKNTLEIGALMFSNKYGVLGKTSSADSIIKWTAEEYNG